MVEIGLRTATAADTEFLYRCLRYALGPYVEQAFGPWDEEQQRSLFFESTDPASHDVVSVDGEAAGCTCIPVCADHIEVKRIFSARIPEPWHRRALDEGWDRPCALAPIADSSAGL